MVMSNQGIESNRHRKVTENGNMPILYYSRFDPIWQNYTVHWRPHRHLSRHTCVSRHAGSMARSRSTSFDAPMRRICCPMQSYTLPFWDLRKGPPESSYISGIQSVASRSNAINLGRDTECIESGVRLMARDLTEERHAMQLWMDLHPWGTMNVSHV